MTKILFKQLFFLFLICILQTTIKGQEPTKVGVLNQDCIERSFRTVFQTKSEFDSSTKLSFTIVGLINANGKLTSLEIHQVDTASIVF